MHIIVNVMSIPLMINRLTMHVYLCMYLKNSINVMGVRKMLSP